MSAILTNKFM